MTLDYVQFMRLGLVCPIAWFLVKQSKMHYVELNSPLYLEWYPE